MDALTSTAVRPVCVRLKVLFGDLSSEPLPDEWSKMADALDAALERGDLFVAGAAGRSMDKPLTPHALYLVR